MSKEETSRRARQARIPDGRLPLRVENGDPVLFSSIEKTIRGFAHRRRLLLKLLHVAGQGMPRSAAFDPVRLVATAGPSGSFTAAVGSCRLRSEPEEEDTNEVSGSLVLDEH